MSTIEINRMEDVRVGDDITLTRDGVTVSGTLESSGTSLRPDANWHMYFVGVGTLYGRDGWTLISATREVHEYEPGTAGTATVRGVEGVRVMRTSGTGGADIVWLSASMVSGVRGHEGCQVTDFVPDDAESLRRSLEVAREGHRKEATGWRAQIRRMGAEVDRLDADLDNARAEVERLRAELEGLRDAMDGSTHFLISSGGTIWHHDQNCPNRRTVPTRDQVAEILRARMGGNIEAWHDDADAILALFEQGGSNLRGEAESK